MDEQTILQSNLQRVSQERNQHVCVGAMLPLMINGPDAQLALQGAKHRLDLRELHIPRPQHGGIFAGEIRAADNDHRVVPRLSTWTCRREMKTSISLPPR